MTRTKRKHIRLLRQAAQHWDDNAKAALAKECYDGGPDGCVLCELYFYVVWCTGCPLYENGLGCCDPEDRPWSAHCAWELHLENYGAYGSRAAKLCRAVALQCRELADWLERGGDEPPPIRRKKERMK